MKLTTKAALLMYFSHFVRWSDGALGERPGVRSAGSLGATASSGRSGGGTVRATVAAESYTIYSDEQDQGKEEVNSMYNHVPEYS